MSTETIEVTVFGRPAVRVGSTTYTSFRSNRIPALLMFLCISASPCPRTEIAEALWPNSESAKAKQNLRQTLLYARKLLGPEAILSDSDRLALHPEVFSDFDLYFNLLQAVDRKSGSFVLAEQLLNLVSNGFMPGYQEPWVNKQRDQMISATCNQVCHFLESRIETAPAEAIDLLDRLIQLNPLMEFPRTLKVQALMKLGLPQSAEFLTDEYARIVRANRERTTNSLRRDSERNLKKDDQKLLSIESAISCLISLGEFKEAADLLTSAVSYLATGSRGTQAIKWLDEIEKCANFALSQPRQERLSVLRAEFLKGLGKTNEALDLMSRLLDQTRQPGVKARAHLLIAQLELSLHRTESARKNLQLGTQLAKGLNMGRELVRANAFAVQMAFQNSDFEACQELGWRTAKLCREDQDVITEIYVLSTIAQAQLRTGKSISKTLDALTRCDRKLEEAGLPFGKLVRLNIARHQEEMGQLELALEGYLKGVASAEELEDGFALAIGLTYLGDLYERLDKPEESIQAHRKALFVREPLGDVLGAACSHRGLGRSELRAGRLDLAQRELIRSAELFQKVQDVNGFASALCLLALTYDAGGKKEQAGKVARRALNMTAHMPPGYRERMGPTFSEVIDKVEKLLPGFGELANVSTLMQ